MVEVRDIRTFDVKSGKKCLLKNLCFLLLYMVSNGGKCDSNVFGSGRNERRNRLASEEYQTDFGLLLYFPCDFICPFSFMSEIILLGFLQCF